MPIPGLIVKVAGIEEGCHGGFVYFGAQYSRVFAVSPCDDSALHTASY